MNHGWRSGVALALVCAWAATIAACQSPAHGESPAPAPAGAAPAAAGSPLRLIEPPVGAEWRLPAGDNANTRYSSLQQIDASNAKDLKVLGVISTGIARG